MALTHMYTQCVEDVCVLGVYQRFKVMWEDDKGCRWHHFAETFEAAFLHALANDNASITRVLHIGMVKFVHSKIAC